MRPNKRSPRWGPCQLFVTRWGKSQCFPKYINPGLRHILSVNARVTLLAIHLKLKVAIVQDALHQFCGCPWPAQGAPAGGIMVCGAEEFSDLSGFSHGAAVALQEEGCGTAVDAAQVALVG